MKHSTDGLRSGSVTAPFLAGVQPEMVPEERNRRWVLDHFCIAFRLSKRESQVVSLAAIGLASKQIAERIGCSPTTVDVYWTRLYRKTQCRSHIEVLAALLRIACAASSVVTAEMPGCHHQVLWTTGVRPTM